MSDTDTEERPYGTGRLLTGTAWLVLLLGLWLWGGRRADVPSGPVGPATGDMAAAGRPAQDAPTPRAARPPTRPSGTIPALPSPVSVHLLRTGP
ncbi:hypothetical protein [Streptomyces sp. NPDC018610]|uniref:hypothetical protein n=1 Tax=Streptomyces sp. NPDC018610 TaxID=3365049 RepID=UPI0037AE51CF